MSAVMPSLSPAFNEAPASSSFLTMPCLPNLAACIRAVTPAGSFASTLFVSF